MVGELHDLALGPVSPAIAIGFASLSGLLGIILATRARRLTGLRRVRLVVYAAVSLAGPGIWLPGLVGVLGLRVDGSVIRIDPERLAVGLGGTFVVTALALLVLSYGHVGTVRLIASGILLAVAVTGSAAVTLGSLRTGGQLLADPMVAAAGLAAAAIAGLMLAFALGLTRSPGRAVAFALPLGLAVTAVHVIAAASLAVRPLPSGYVPADEVVGLNALRIVLPAIILGGSVLALMCYFGLGTFTRRDLRLTFDPTAEGEQIEPWMIEQVRARVALSSTALTPSSGWGSNVWAETTVAVRSIPLLGGTVASAFARPRPAIQGAAEHLAAGTIDGVVSAAEGAAESAPAWRPVPGWGVPGAARSMMSPAPEPAHAGAPAGEAPWRSQRPDRWDRREWDQHERSQREAAEGNESRLPRRTPTMNSRPGQYAQPAERAKRKPAPEVLVAAGGDDWLAPTPGRPPLPRRNARP